MLVMGEKPIRAPTGYPHVYSIAADAERAAEGFGKPRCLPDISRVGFGFGRLRR